MVLKYSELSNLMLNELYTLGTAKIVYDDQFNKINNLLKLFNCNKKSPEFLEAFEYINLYDIISLIGEDDNDLEITLLFLIKNCHKKILSGDILLLMILFKIKQGNMLKNNINNINNNKITNDIFNKFYDLLLSLKI
jgi:hypothetical protein